MFFSFKDPSKFHKQLKKHATLIKITYLYIVKVFRRIKKLNFTELSKQKIHTCWFLKLFFLRLNTWNIFVTNRGVEHKFSNLNSQNFCYFLSLLLKFFFNFWQIFLLLWLSSTVFLMELKSCRSFHEKMDGSLKRVSCEAFSFYLFWVNALYTTTAPHCTCSVHGNGQAAHLFTTTTTAAMYWDH